jgi:hypothetical protein
MSRGGMGMPWDGEYGVIAGICYSVEAYRDRPSWG